ncbi:MAG: type IV pilin protein [Neisseriaceae bacterium]|nr:type IV pilin protein [Neisseriaceae bacterium]
MKKSLGFTLIELMIVVAIIALLSSFAMPRYTQYVARADRKDVQTEMLDIAARLEQYYALNNSYSLSNVITATGAPPRTSQNGKYDIIVTENSTSTDGTFNIEAMAKPGTTATNDKVNDVFCAKLTLNSATTQTPIECWN